MLTLGLSIVVSSIVVFANEKDPSCPTEPIPTTVYVESLLLANESEGIEFLKNRGPCNEELSYKERQTLCRERQQCPKLVAPYHWEEILPYQRAIIFKCIKMKSDTPKNDCVSVVAATQRQRNVAFMLNDGTLKTIIVKEDNGCRCENNCILLEK